MKPRWMLLLPILLVLGCTSLPPPQGARAADEPDEAFEQDPLLAEAGIDHVVVPEAFITAATPEQNVDSPASWRTQQGQRLLFATAKAGGRLMVYDGNSGSSLGTVAAPGKGAGQLDRPNGIAVIDNLLLVVERDNHRVQAFALPGYAPLLSFGADALKQPYGLWVRRHADGYEVIVSDNYMAADNEDVPPPLDQLGQRFHRYQLRRDGAGWAATATGSFGDTGAAGAVRIAESVFGDEAHDRLLLAEEDVATGTGLREYGLDGRYRGRDIGVGLFKAQAEGMALAACADGSGYWIATDQFKDRSLFHVFDRVTLAHRGAFAGSRTANTDGVWLDQSSDARFPEGVFYAVDDDKAVAAFDWRDIRRALALDACKGN